MGFAINKHKKCIEMPAVIKRILEERKCVLYKVEWPTGEIGWVEEPTGGFAYETPPPYTTMSQFYGFGRVDDCDRGVSIGCRGVSISEQRDKLFEWFGKSKYSKTHKFTFAEHKGSAWTETPDTLSEIAKKSQSGDVVAVTAVSRFSCNKKLGVHMRCTLLGKNVNVIALKESIFDARNDYNKLVRCIETEEMLLGSIADAETHTCERIKTDKSGRKAVCGRKADRSLLDASGVYHWYCGTYKGNRCFTIMSNKKNVKVKHKCERLTKKGVCGANAYRSIKGGGGITRWYCGTVNGSRCLSRMMKKS